MLRATAEISGLMRRSLSPDWPRGSVVQRTLASTRFEKSFPGAPEGEYAVLAFRTAFEKEAGGTETVTLEREPDGIWRVVGYTIR
jgi:hypothetical protein